MAELSATNSSVAVIAGMSGAKSERAAGEPAAHDGAAAAAVTGEVPPAQYDCWSDVPAGLVTQTRLADADPPRRSGGPARAYVRDANWRGKQQTFALYAVAESVPTAATGRQLAAAAQRRSGGPRCGRVTGAGLPVPSRCWSTVGGGCVRRAGMWRGWARCRSCCGCAGVNSRGGPRGC